MVRRFRVRAFKTELGRSPALPLLASDSASLSLGLPICKMGLAVDPTSVRGMRLKKLIHVRTKSGPPTEQ